VNPTATGRALSSRDRPNAKGDATRQLILLAAERLFAERGIAAVSLRDIALAAGQRNNCAVQYHFGDREDLLREITAYRSRLSDDVRAAMLAELTGGGRWAGVKELIAAFVVPLARHFEGDNHYLAFLSRYVIERGGYGGFETAQASASVITLGRMVRRLLPDQPGTLFQERWAIATTGAVHAMARYQTLMKTSHLPAPIDDLVEDLVNVVTAGIAAPHAASGRRRRRRVSTAGN
jgi:AcrR family transcriptional regulator